MLDTTSYSPRLVLFYTIVVYYESFSTVEIDEIK